MDFTPSQRKALDLERNIAVTASAGSGKTSVLVQRYIRILEQRPELGVANILAITFTNKAAAEMRERVRQAVNLRIAERPDEEERWLAVRDSLPAAHISTIHSFCSSLLRERPIEAGVDPDFNLLEDADKRLMLAEAIETTIQDAANLETDAPLRNALAKLLRMWNHHRLGKIIEDFTNKREVVDPCFEQIRGQSDDEMRGWIEGKLTRASENVLQALLLDDELSAQVGELGALEPMADSAKAQSDKINQARLQALRLWAGITQNEGLAQQLGYLGEFGNIKLAGGSKKLWDAQALERCKEILKALRGRASEAFKACPQFSEVDRYAIRLLRALGVMYYACAQAYRDRKTHAAQLDFADLEDYASALLKTDVGGVREQYRRQFNFVLVDEFQDTNHRQWEIIDQLTRDDPNKLFVVGDPKQSIYAFRGAEIEVFNLVKREAITEVNRKAKADRVEFGSGHPVESSLDERLGDITMAENFRSRQAVVDFINCIFEHVMGRGGHNWEPPYEPLIAARRDDQPGAVELLLVTEDAAHSDTDDDADPNDAPGPIERQALLLASRLRALVEDEGFVVHDKERGEHRQAEYSDAVILLRSRSRLAYFEDALRAYGIPFDVASGRGFYQRQEVRDVANALRFLANHYDDIALAGVLRSPFFGLSDGALFLVSRAEGESLFDKLGAMVPRAREVLGDEAAALEFAHATLSRWLSIGNRLVGSELIRRILEDTAAWGLIGSGPRGEQDRANMDKLILVAQQFHGRGLESLGDLAERLDMLGDWGVQEGEAPLREAKSGVRIMTVHAAKGLEAPIVAVANMGARFNMGSYDSVFADREFGIGILAPNPEAGYAAEATSLRKAIGAISKAKVVAEEKRLFYVACTRARDMLLLAGNAPQTQADCWAKWTLDALGVEDGERNACFEQDGRSYAIPIHDSAEEFGAPQPQEAGEPLYVKADAALRTPCAEPSSKEFESWQQAVASLAAPSVRRRCSPTELMLFRECPMRHYFAYELGLPEAAVALDEPAAAQAHDDARAAAIRRGTAAHRVFERLAPDAPQQDAELVRAVLNEFEELSQAERESFASDLLDMVRQFRKSAFGQRVLGAADARNEASFMLKVGSACIQGQIDKLYRGPDGWAILDYKTNSISPAQKPALAEHYRLQLETYALAAWRLLGDPVEGIDAHLYFTEINDTASVWFTSNDIGRIERDLGKLVAALDAFTPPDKPSLSPACGNCGYRETGACMPG